MTGAHAIYRYRLFGLSIDSEIALPELADQEIAVGSEPSDLCIALGRAQAGEGFLLDIPDVAKFAISGGRSISVAPAPGAGEREIRLFLLGSAMGIALHQLGLLPLHANAVEVDGRAVAFAGRSGSGKSTLAAWFHDQGFRILADDVCVVRIVGDGTPMAYPGLPRLRLWQDALEASGRSASAHPPSFHGSRDNRRKFDVSISPADFAAEPLRLSALFALEGGPDLTIERLPGASAVEAISANTYRGRFIAEVGDSAGHVAACVAIARQAPVCRLQRPFDRSEFDAQCAAILEYLRAQLPSG